MRYTAAHISSPMLDQKLFTGVPRKLLILSPPRTGSTMLCRHLLNAGLGVPHEYFNEIFIRSIGVRLGLPSAGHPLDMPAEDRERYLRLLFALRSKNALFAVKVQHKHYRLFLRDTIAPELFRGAVLVYLTRRDLLGQAVSWHFAELSGRWGFEDEVATRPRAEKNYFDAAAIDFYLREITAEMALWEILFLQNQLKPLRITYEDLRQNPAAILCDIAARCGVAADRLKLDYDDEGPYRCDPTQPSKAAVIEFCEREWQKQSRGQAVGA